MNPASLRTLAVSLTVPLILVAVSTIAFISARNSASAGAKAMAKPAVEMAAAGIERGFAIPLEASEKLAAQLSKNPGQDRSEIGIAASEILASAPWITGVSVAPDAVVKYHFPEQGNESLVGHDLMTNPERRDALLEAVQRRTSVLTGPVESVDTSANIFIRTPVFSSVGDFWGFVSVSIDLPYFLKEYGPDEKESPLRFAFLSPGAGAESDKPSFVWGDESVARAAYVSSTIKLPGGAAWLLAAAPGGGWSESNPYPLVLYLLALAASVCAFFASWHRGIATSLSGGRSGPRSVSGGKGTSGGDPHSLAGSASRELGFFATKAMAGIDDFESGYGGLSGSRAAFLKGTSRLRENLRPFTVFAAELSDYSEAASGRLAIERREFEPGAMVAAIERELSSDASAKGLSLHCSVARDVPSCIRSDAAKLARALTILLRESISRSERGEVSLAVLAEAAKGKTQVLRFVIRDEGSRVAPDRAASVFEAFSAVRGPLSERVGTSGMGMACAKALLDSMHADVSVQPGAEIGLTITCIIPFESPRTAATPVTATAAVAPDAQGVPSIDACDTCVESDAAGIESARILESAQVLESAPPPEAAAAEFPRDAGAADFTDLSAVIATARESLVATADSGIVAEGLPTFASFLARNRSDAVRRFKGPVVAGAVFMPEDESEADSSIPVESPEQTDVKPELSDEIIEIDFGLHSANAIGLIGRPAVTGKKEDADLPVPAEARPQILRQQQQPSDTGHHLSRAFPSILLVDDGEVNREIMVRMLTSRGYLCDTADGGASALEHCAVRDYDLVFMDCFMPGIDGYAATMKLREMRGATRPRIVGMSAMLRGGEAERCKAAGMDDMIAKPFTVDELAKKIELWGGDSFD